MAGNPVLYIQCDWDDAISCRQPKGKAWITLKKRGEPNSIHGKLENSGNDNIIGRRISGTDGFVAEFVAGDLCKVEHKESLTSISFLAPTKIYAHIHKKSWITSLDVASKAGLSVSYSVGNDLLVWDFNRDELKIKLEGHIGDVYRCKFFPSEKVILTSGADRKIKVWCAQTGKCPVTLVGHTMAVTDFVIVDIGRNAISVSKDGTARLWDFGQTKCLDTLISVPCDINCCALCNVPVNYCTEEPEVQPDEREFGTQNKVLLVGCENSVVHGVHVYSRKKLFTIALESPVNAIGVSSTVDESTLHNIFVIGCQNGSVHFYSLEDVKKPLKVVWDMNSSVLSVASYGCQGVFVSHADGSVYFLKHGSYEKVLSLTGPDCEPVYDMAVSDMRFLYTACRDGVIRRYDVDRAFHRV